MQLSLYNYLTRKKELFIPLKKAWVGLYTCGPTVYHYAHIGNLRTYTFEDILRRALELSGYRVRHIMNLTDVDDKTIRDSKKAKKPLRAFTSIYIKAFFSDLKKLNIKKAEKYTRATDYIREMIKLIQTLLQKGFAYQAPEGVYFSIGKFREYGKLSNVERKNLKAGARVSADEYTKDRVEDFVLWKAKKPGEPSWKSPFGEGRPGWHIECSAMSMKYLGTTFDIHAGAVDLLFPHHEDEIAQSEGATGKPFAKIFMEGEHLIVDGKKMSKSLGNYFVLSDIEKRGFSPLDFRYLVLGAHYRTQLNFTWKSLEAARSARRNIFATLERLWRGPFGGTLKDDNEALKVIATVERQFKEAIADDLNAPKALALTLELLNYGSSLFDRKLLSKRTAKMIAATIFEFDKVLGLNLKKQKPEPPPSDVKKLLKEREWHRSRKQWREADKVREKIRDRGYLVEDTAQGPIARPK